MSAVRAVAASTGAIEHRFILLLSQVEILVRRAPSLPLFLVGAR